MSYSAKEIQMIQYATKLQEYCERRECEHCPFQLILTADMKLLHKADYECIIGVPQFWELEKTIGRKDV